MTAKKPLSSSGASRMKSRYQRMISRARDSGHSVGPATTVSTGCAWNSKAVTTPKLPPPPRSAQKRSGCSSSLARTSVPSARTTSAAIRLSMVRPKRRVRWPVPPPSVSPATPVLAMNPLGTASP